MGSYGEQRAQLQPACRLSAIHLTISLISPFYAIQLIIMDELFNDGYKAAMRQQGVTRRWR